jgi:hypothetical protein
MSKRKKKEGIPLDTPTSMDQATGNDSNSMIQVKGPSYGSGTKSKKRKERAKLHLQAQSQKRERHLRAMDCIIVNDLAHHLFRSLTAIVIHLCALLHEINLTLILQTGQKRRLVSFGPSKSEATTSAVGNASVVIETSAGRPSSSSRATINVTSGGRATAKIKSTSTAHGSKD